MEKHTERPLPSYRRLMILQPEYMVCLNVRQPEDVLGNTHIPLAPVAEDFAESVFDEYGLEL